MCGSIFLRSSSSNFPSSNSYVGHVRLSAQRKRRGQPYELRSRHPSLSKWGMWRRQRQVCLASEWASPLERERELSPSLQPSSLSTLPYVHTWKEVGSRQYNSFENTRKWEKFNSFKKKRSASASDVSEAYLPKAIFQANGIFAQEFKVTMLQKQFSQPSACLSGSVSACMMSCLLSKAPMSFREQNFAPISKPI